MTLKELVNTTENWFKIKESLRDLTRKEIEFWLNMGQNDIVAKAEILRSTVSDSSEENLQNYPYPANCAKILRVRYACTATDKYTLNPITEDELDIMNANWRTASSGRPIVFFLKDNEVNLYPKPNGDGVDNILFDIVALPNAMSGDDAQPFNSIATLQIYCPVIIDYVIWKLAPSVFPMGILQNPAYLSYFKKNYYEGVEEIRRDVMKLLRGKYDRLQPEGGVFKKTVSLPTEPYTP